MSGTRLNAAAIRGDRVELDRFHAQAPPWPWLDLPFSYFANLFFRFLPRKPATSGSVRAAGIV